MDCVLVSENSTLLYCGDEKYDVTELPQNTSLIVEEKKKDLLGKLCLVQTFETMKNAETSEHFGSSDLRRVHTSFMPKARISTALSGQPRRSQRSGSPRS